MSGEHVWEPTKEQVDEIRVWLNVNRQHYNYHPPGASLGDEPIETIARAVISASPYPRIAEALERLEKIADREHLLGCATRNAKVYGAHAECSCGVPPRAAEARASLAALKTEKEA